MAAGHHVTSTGIDNRKMGFWLFLASECMFFGSFLVGYLVNKGNSLTGPTPKDLFNIELTTVSSFVLLASSLFMVLAVSAIQKGDMAGLKKWILATALGGLVFLGFQIYEFAHFVEMGLLLGGPGSSLLGTAFYVLTGFHGFHVAIGILWLLGIWVNALRGKLSKESAMGVEVAGLYWHFVDVVWIVIFTVVYLVEAV